MMLSEIGVVANIMWYEIKNHAKNIALGEFVVMPNHVHGILILNGNNEFVVKNAANANTNANTNTNANANANACVASAGGFQWGFQWGFPGATNVPSGGGNHKKIIRATTVSEPGKKHPVIYCGQLQIGRIKTCTSIGF